MRIFSGSEFMNFNCATIRVQTNWLKIPMTNHLEVQGHARDRNQVYEQVGDCR